METTGADGVKRELKPNIKGELTYDLCGKTRTLKLSFDAIIWLEDQLDSSVLSLAKKVAVQNVRLKDMALVLVAGMRGGGDENPPSWKEVAEWGLSVGLMTLTNVYVTLLMPTLTAGPKEEAEPGEATTQTTTP